MQNKIFKIVISLVVFLMMPNFAMAADKLLQLSDLNYLGGFRLPQGTFGCVNENECSFAYSKGPIAFNSTNNSMFVAGHIYNQWISEINIPTLVNSTNINLFNEATIRQNFANLFPNINTIADCGNGCYIGGLLTDGSKMTLSAYDYYDSTYSATKSHATANANWSGSIGANGPFSVGGNTAAIEGQVGGYMSWIPASWRTAMGGPALTGLSSVAITTRTSVGPSSWVFDPATLIGLTSEIKPAVNVVGYPDGHRTLGEWGASSMYVSGADQISGVVWPEGSKTVLFFGQHGDTFCYGNAPGDCVDPVRSGVHGVHGYPYHAHVWAYDANDLLAVKNGTKNPWDLVPYGNWNIENTFGGLASDENSIVGATYDATTQRIYLAVADRDGSQPAIYAYGVDVVSATDVVAPSAPSNLSVQ